MELGNVAINAAVGGGLFYGVQKFFKEVEEKLSEHSKSEIAHWLLSLKTADKVHNWPAMFSTMFDRVFGKEHLSVRCFIRSCCASVALFALSLSVFLATRSLLSWRERFAVGIYLVFFGIFSNLLPDYISLLETRVVLSGMAQSSRLIVNPDSFSEKLFTLVTQTYYVWKAPLQDKFFRIFCLPFFFSSLWLWIYLGAGFLLKTARRFDTGLSLVNRYLDIEHKPLQCIGLVGGSTVAIAYWLVRVLAYLNR
jgi:hypothetical protein